MLQAALDLAVASGMETRWPAFGPGQRQLAGSVRSMTARPDARRIKYRQGSISSSTMPACFSRRKTNEIIVIFLALLIHTHKMDMEIMNNTNDRIQLGRNLLSFIFTTGLALGGIVFIAYCLRIGYFPQGISFGDSVLFIFLAISFGFLYSLFVLCLTSLGITARPLWHGLQKTKIFLSKKFKTSPANEEQIYFTIEKPEAPLYILAAFGIFFIVLLTHFEWKGIATLVFCSFICASMWSKHVQNAHSIHLLGQKNDLLESESGHLTQLKRMQPVFILMIILTPLTFGGITGAFLDGAMRMSNLRIDSAVVHIKEPYTTLMSENGLVGDKSNFGNEYLKYSNVNVLFQGIGKNVVVEKNIGKDVISLPIPAESIFIVKAKKK
ncbi:hypothetical protein D3C72_817930 [compost metagenome]